MERAKPATWKDYFERTKGRPPRKLLVTALGFLKNRGQALDLGSGALNDSAYLVAEGFKHVTAVDKEPVAKEISEMLPKDVFNYVISSFEDFNFAKDTYDLINAQYALPFIDPKKFREVFAAIIDSLKTDGIFTGQFFGDRDEWKNDTAMTFVTRALAEEYIKDLTVLSFTEEERDKETALGELKHWHVFHFIVCKK